MLEFLITFAFVIFIIMLIKKVTKRINKKANERVQSESALEYNQKKFDKFYDDLNKDTLPNIPEPTEEEIRKYMEKCEKELLRFKDNEKVIQNNSIPIEVCIWVDKVYDYYLSDLKHQFGVIHRCEAARKNLYQYKGYTWYTISECHPEIIFD